MAHGHQLRKLVFLVVTAFSVLLALSATSEMLDLPNLLFGMPPTPVNWSETLLESLFIFLVGTAVLVVIWKLENKRSKAVQGLKKSEQKFRSLAECSPAMIFITDGRRIYYANDKMVEYLGYAREELLEVDNGLLGVFPDEFRNIVANSFKEISSRDEKSEVECKISLKNGEQKEVVVLTETIIYEGKRVILCLMYDITQRKLTESRLLEGRSEPEKDLYRKTKELLRVQSELSDAKRLSDIGVLSSMVAHELRNPLGVIKTATYNMRGKTRDKNIFRHLDNIEKKIDESNYIIENLLSYSKIRMPNYEDVDLCQILNECMAFAADKHCTKKIDFANERFSGGGAVVQADRVQMTELFSNIIDNACQAIDSDNGKIVVNIERLDDGENVLVTVEDNGAGIEPEEMDRITDPFYTSKARGIGLGLTVCKEITGLHGGELSFASTPGKGTRVLVKLPIQH